MQANQPKENNDAPAGQSVGGYADNPSPLAVGALSGNAKPEVVSRERFEKWVSATYPYDLFRMGNGYRSNKTSALWMAWQASLEAKPSEREWRGEFDVSEQDASFFITHDDIAVAEVFGKGDDSRRIAHALASYKPSEWVLCEQELPREWGTYLVFGVDKEISTCEFIGGDWDTPGVRGDSELFGITHWKPLDAPPVAEQAEPTSMGFVGKSSCGCGWVSRAQGQAGSEELLAHMNGSHPEWNTPYIRSCPQTCGGRG